MVKLKCRPLYLIATVLPAFGMDLRKREAGLLPQHYFKLKYNSIETQRITQGIIDTGHLMFNAAMTDDNVEVSALQATLTAQTSDLVPCIIREPDLLSSILDECKPDEWKPSVMPFGVWVERMIWVESMIMWHLVDSDTASAAKRMPVLLKHLRTQKSNKSLLYSMLIDIYKDHRLPSSTEKSFTNYLKSKIELEKFPELAAFIQEYEMERSAYREHYELRIQEK